MAVSVDRAGAGALGTVEQTARYVEPNRPRARRRPGRCVGWSDSGCVD
jgi:hypothetical protein